MFEKSAHVVKFEISQRSNLLEAFEEIEIEFSNDVNIVRTLKKQKGLQEVNVDSGGVVSWMKIKALSVYGRINNGYKEIVIYMEKETDRSKYDKKLRKLSVTLFFPSGVNCKHQCKT